MEVKDHTPYWAAQFWLLFHQISKLPAGEPCQFQLTHLLLWLSCPSNTRSHINTGMLSLYDLLQFREFLHFHTIIASVSWWDTKLKWQRFLHFHIIPASVFSEIAHWNGRELFTFLLLQHLFLVRFNIEMAETRKCWWMPCEEFCSWYFYYLSNNSGLYRLSTEVCKKFQCIPVSCCFQSIEQASSSK